MNSSITVTKTPGGLPVIVDKMPFSHAASLSVYMGAGSRDEVDEQAGIAHMLEHMMFKGTKNRTAKQMSEEIEAAGGEQNGYTTKEVTSYQAYAIDETVATGQDILADLVLNPNLDRECLGTERNVVIQEIRMLENDPEEYIHVLFTETMWGDHPMGRSEAGSVQTVSSLSEKDIRAFYETHYRPPRMAVVAAGNVDVDQIVGWAEKSFDPLERTNHAQERSAPKPLAQFKVYPREDKQAYVGMGFPGRSSVDPDRFSQRLMTSILGMGTSSRLFQEIREKTGLVYEIFASSSSYTDCGSIGIFFNTSVTDQEKVVRMVADQIRRMKEDGLEKDELHRAKNLTKGVYVRKLESSETRMIRLGEMFMSTGEALSGEETLERIDAVTEESILNAAEELMVRDRLSIALHAPGKESEKAAKSLGDLDL